MNSQGIKKLLRAWANWSYCRIGTEYKTPFYPAEPGIYARRPLLSDIDALLLDQAVAGLRSYDTKGYNIIRLHYQYHFSCRAIARNLQKRPDYVTSYLARAEAYIAGRAHNLLANAA